MSKMTRTHAPAQGTHGGRQMVPAFLSGLCQAEKSPFSGCVQEFFPIVFRSRSGLSDRALGIL